MLVYVMHTLVYVHMRVYVIKQPISTLVLSPGVDPVHEAIAEYNRTRQGIAVPPDVFLGLRFADGQEEVPGTSGQAGKVGAMLGLAISIQ